MTPDAIIKVRLKTAAEGGRKSDIVVTDDFGHFYGCPLFVNEQGFDCRIIVSNRTLRLGETYELPVKFMDPSRVLARLTPGMPIRLWEGREIAVGEVVSILGQVC